MLPKLKRLHKGQRLFIALAAQDDDDNDEVDKEEEEEEGSTALTSPQLTQKTIPARSNTTFVPTDDVHSSTPEEDRSRHTSDVEPDLILAATAPV